jgi:hypothetical protein
LFHADVGDEHPDRVVELDEKGDAAGPMKPIRALARARLRFIDGIPSP